MNWIGQHIWSFISRFRSDVYLEDLTTDSSTDILVVDSNNKVCKNSAAGDDMTFNVTGDSGTPEAIVDGNTLDIAGGTDITTAVSSTDTVTVTHDDVDTSTTSSSASPAHGATFTAVDTVSINARGHVTGVNTKTVTLPTETGDISGVALTADTGIDLTSVSGATGGAYAATIGVDVSDFMTNGTDNYVLTATGTDAINAEANLTFDGSTLSVEADANTTANALFIDANSLTTGSAINIDVDDALLGASTKSLSIIDYDKAGVAGDGIGNTTTGLNINLADTATNHANSTVSMVGAQIDLDVADNTGNGPIQKGLVLNVAADGVGSAANTFGVEMEVMDGGTDIRMKSSAVPGDRCDIETSTNGATTISTLDSDNTNHLAHFEVAADGNITLDSAAATNIESVGLIKLDGEAGVEIENGAAAAALLIDNNTVDQIALNIEASNTSVPAVKIKADAIDATQLLLVQAVDSTTTDSSGIGYMSYIDYRKSAVVGNGDNRNMFGHYINMQDNATNHASSTVHLVGQKISVDAAGTTTNSATGIDLIVTDAAANQGLKMKVTDGGNDIKILSSANINDYCTIQVGAEGATTITTEDQNTAAAHFGVVADGKITMTPADITGDVFHLDADADTDNITNIDVGVLDIDATSTATITTAGLTKFDCYGVEIENNGSTTALLIDQNHAKQIALDIDSVADDVNAVQINASALTTGDGFLLQDSANNTSTRNTAYIYQSHAMSTGATALKVQSAGGDTAVLIEKDTGATAGAINAQNSKALKIESIRLLPSYGTNAHNDVGIDVLVTSASKGTSSLKGIDIDVNGASDGTSTAYGIDLDVGGADTNIGIQTSVTDATGTDIKMMSSADADDYCTINTTTNGATHIRTVKDGVDATAHLSVVADGNVDVDGLTITLDAGTAIALEANTAITGTCNISSIPNAGVDTDKFLVDNSGRVEYRTGAEIISDLGIRDSVQYMHVSGASVTEEGVAGRWMIPGNNGVNDHQWNTDSGTTGVTVDSTTMTLDFNKCANGIIIPNACTFIGFQGLGRNNSSDTQYEAGIFIANGAGTGAGIDYGCNTQVHEFVLRAYADADVTGGVSSCTSYRGPGKLSAHRGDGGIALAAGDAILPALSCIDSPGDKIYASLTIMLLIDTVA